MTQAMINKHMTVIGKVGVCNINTGLFRLQDSLNYLCTGNAPEVSTGQDFLYTFQH